MFNFLLILFFALFAWLAWRNLLYGLALITAFLPSYLIRFQVFGTPLTLLEGMILLIAGIWLIKKRPLFVAPRGLTRNDKQAAAWLITTLAFLLAATLSAAISPNARAAWGVWKAYFIEPILFFVALISTIKTRQELHKLLYALAAGAFAVSTFAVVQKFTGWHIPNPFWQVAATRRVTSFFGYPNAVSLYLAPIIPLIIYLLAQARQSKYRSAQVFLDATIILSLLAIIFAKSTGALIALAATALIYGLFILRFRKWTLLALVSVALLWPFVPSRENISKEILLRDTSGQIRVFMWAETLEMLKKNPLLGKGLATYKNAVRPYHILKWAEIYLYPHNLFLTFWSETGFLGLLAFVILIWLYYKELWLVPGDGLTLALGASMLIILIHGLVDVPYFKNDLSVFFWLLVGITILQRRAAVVKQ